MALHGAHDIERYLHASATRLDGMLPDEVSISLVVHGPGGGSWMLTTQGNQVRVKKGLARWPDCTIECELRHFLDVVFGHANARAAFLDGRLRLEGDVGLAMRLQEVLLTSPTTAMAVGG